MHVRGSVLVIDVMTIMWHGRIVIVLAAKLIRAKKAHIASTDIEETRTMYSFGIEIDKCISSTSGKT